MRKRVVITGMGALTPLAIGVEPSWQALCAGKSGIGPITYFDATPFKCQVAGEVRGFRPEDWVSKKLITRMDRFTFFALAATRMALDDARLEINAANADRTAVVLGTAVGGAQTWEKNCKLVFDGQAQLVSPFFTPSFICNMGAGQISIQFGIRGPNFCPVGGCSAGTYAVGEAARLIQRGDADIVVAGGAESAITSVILAGLDALRATTTSHNTQPEKASRPFEKTRDGFVPAEGAGIMIVEDLEVALRRGARIYAELIGYGANSDAYHIVSPSPDGEGGARCMRLALKDAGIAPEEVDYINAHGTSTVVNDFSETIAVKKVFGEHARKVAISSNKSMIGHMWGAAGIAEAIFAVLTIRDGIIPPTINYESPDPQCDLDYVPNTARKARVRVAMSNSFGFAGSNGCLIFREFTG